jgi:4-amino-4-deoxy-L-arabinose transferase-like glycosyltransferase
MKSRKASSVSKAPLIIFGVALGLRLLFLLLMLANVGATHLVDQFKDPIKYFTAADYLFNRTETGQYELFLVGAGYPLFIGICNTIFGHIYWPILLIQIILSSYTCVMIYKLAQLITRNLAISVIAGILAAVSLTSISLANALLSETVFFFLFTFSLYLFFKGLSENQWKSIILSGILGGAAVLVRSVAMFYPVLLVVFAFLFTTAGLSLKRKSVLLKAAITALIMIFIPALWGLKNITEHGTFTVSGTGVLAAKTYLTAGILTEAEGRRNSDFPRLRDSLYQSSLAEYQVGNYQENQSKDIEFILSSIRKYPSVFLNKYFSIVLDNATAVSKLQFVQLPGLTDFFNAVDKLMRRSSYNDPLVLVFSLVGFFIIARKNLNIALILLINIIYFAAMSGITFAQGSRIFFPALSTQSILVATTILFFYNLARAGWNSLLSGR